MDTTDTWTSDDPCPSREALPGAPAAVGDIVADRWRVLQVRRGGQAWVLVVDDVERGIRRAIKVPLWDCVIAGDAELAMLLDIEPNPHVVSALDVAEFNGYRGIVLEYVPLTLGELLRKQGTEALSDAIALALQQVCDGFAHLSEVTEVAHLDLKPSNVLIDAEGHAKIADFGLAQRVRIENGRFPVPRGGTWAYAAPEVLRQEPCDTRADIFSFGVLLYRACTGRYPYPEHIDKKLRDKKTDRSAQRKLLLDYYDSPGPRERTKEFYYWDQVKRTQLPATVPDHNINILLSGLLMRHRDERHRSFDQLSPLLARALRHLPQRATSAPLHRDDQQRRELALSQTLIRLGRFGDAVTRLNRLLASPLPEALSPLVIQAAEEALTSAGRHAEAAALRDWRLSDAAA